ncbi:tetratricopeptide repeat protein [Symmachiella dynata]|uniref:tetratricopeptide repeat protein n=1 Tax=Symmachiella dynata TaxID=2527995 RepID=UPI0030EE6D8A
MLCRGLLLIVSAVCLLLAQPLVADEKPDVLPLYQRQTKKVEKTYNEVIQRQTAAIEADPANDRAYSRRGDAYFFTGQYDKAVADYEKMVELDPEIAVQHWRLGLAYYYAGQYAKTAKQLGLYHAYDDQDRENGIWIFLAQAQADGVAAARKKMIRYKKDDRPPLPDVYRMFEGKLTADELLKRIEAEIKQKKLPQATREQRLFYAHLYIGLFAEAEKNPQQARESFLAATEQTWPLKAGGGPAYMWHCARLRLLELDKVAASDAKAKD